MRGAYDVKIKKKAYIHSLGRMESFCNVLSGGKFKKKAALNICVIMLKTCAE